MFCASHDLRRSASLNQLQVYVLECPSDLANELHLGPGLDQGSDEGRVLRLGRVQADDELVVHRLNPVDEVEILETPGEPRIDLAQVKDNRPAVQSASQGSRGVKRQQPCIEDG